MREIQLTQGQVTIVDDWNYEWLNQWKWCAQWYNGSRSFYAVRSVRVKGKPSLRINVHRLIAHTPDGVLCDHINHDTLLNTEENLRNVTHSQNNMNKRVRNNTTGEKGIHKNHNGFEVRVKKDKKVVFDKYYQTLEDAIMARDEAYKTFHGDYCFIK